MKWSILILTMPRRKLLLDKLLAVLQPQVDKFSDVGIIIRESDPKIAVGDQRGVMLKEAQGEYVNFIDDDDMVSNRYVSSIRPLLDGIDYVGFPVSTYRDGCFYGMAYHSLRYRSWDAANGYSLRDISHLNPIRRELAIQAEMEGGFGEDQRWAMRLRELGIVKTENYVPEIMYLYMMRSKKEELQ